MTAVAEESRRSPIITGGSQGIGAGLVAGYRQRGWAVVATSRTIKPGGDPDVLTVDGDISEPPPPTGSSAGRSSASAASTPSSTMPGVFISKPFTDYTADDYATVVGVNLTGFFTLTQRAIAEMLKRGTATSSTSRRPWPTTPTRASVRLDVAHQRRPRLGHKVAGDRVRLPGIRVNAVSPGIIQTPVHPAESYAGLGASPPVGHVGQVGDIVDGILFLESSPFITGEILHIDGGQIAGH